MKGKIAMKKISAFLLVLVMVASIISTSIVVTSAAGNQLIKSYDAAADGELLYEVKFGETEGVYKSAYIAAGNKNDPSTFNPTFSADKREMTIAYTPDASRRIWYGGEIEGLTLGTGKNYTFTFKANYDTGNSNAGVYFNFPNSFASDDLVLRTEYNLLRGIYGTPDVRNTVAVGGSKGTGKYISSDKRYITATNGGAVFARNADGWHDMAIEIEGYTYRLYVNNTLFDEANLADENLAVAGKLGLVVYLYNSGTFSIKDVNLYKGATMKGIAQKGAWVVDTPNNPNSTNKLLKTYADAKDGDLLYEVVFNAADGVYVPKVWDNNHKSGGDKPWATDPLIDIEISADGKSVTFTNKGAEGSCWWGNVINGLEVTKDTKYTYEFKAKNNIGGKQVGLGWVTDPNQMLVECYNFYGRFSTVGDSQAQVVIEQSSGKIAGELMGTTDYTPIFPLADADGFTNVKVEIDGFKFYVYYECMYEAGGTTWTLFEQYDMANPEKLSLSVKDNSLAALFYIYNANTSGTFKDVKIYKGLLAPKASAEETTTPEVTTPKETTPAVTTTATPSTTTKAPVVTTEATKGEKGCGSVVVGGIAVVAIVTLAGVAVSKKH